MNQQNTESVKVWDPMVRIFHWSLVITFIIAYLSGEEESDLHAYAGYIIVGLIVFRLLWGFIGTTYARFSNFLYSPQTVWEYLHSLLTRHPKHYLGHNPAGGLMVILMLLSLAFASYTGLKAYGAEGHGPLAANAPGISLVGSAHADDDHYEREEHDEKYEQHEYEDNQQSKAYGSFAQDLPTMGMARNAHAEVGSYEHDQDEDEHDEYEGEENEEEEFWEEIHEASVNLVLFLVFLHVAGVIISSFLHRENLVRAMFTGRKPANIQS